MATSETTERVGGYRVVRRLATGGTSDVLLAKAEGPHGFERTVVLKLLLSQFRNDDELARMFAREASAYARLSHPSIVRLFDFFSQPSTPPGAPPSPGNRDGQLVMVLEYVDGPPLTRLRSMLKAVGKELDDRAAVYVAARIFDALAAAHSATDETGAMAPVIHRDVNPSNVLVPWDGHVKLADFGVAKVTGLTHQSVAGMIKGTYGYMAPEQVTGEAITPRADVYAGGIILWELLSRRRAFQRGALPEIEALRAMAEPRLVSLDAIRPDVDRAIRDAVKRALEPNPTRRTITAEEMVSVLTSVVATDEGREHLVTALNYVRNDPRAASAPMGESRPPPPGNVVPPEKMQTAPMTIQGGALAPAPVPPSNSGPPVTTSRGMLPKSAPRPASVARLTAAYSGMPEPSPPPPPLPTPRNPLASPPQRASPPDLPKRPSAAQRLGSLPETKRNPNDLQTQLAASSISPSGLRAGAQLQQHQQPQQGTRHDPQLSIPTPGEARTLVPSSDKVSLFDSLVEAPAATSNQDVEIPSDRHPSRGGIALDDILRGVPSSMPPSVLNEKSKAPGAVGAAPPTKLSTSTTKMGKFPVAAPPLKSDFGVAVREVQQSEAQTVVPPPSAPSSQIDAPPPTPRMRHPSAISMLGATLAMEARPDGRTPQPQQHQQSSQPQRQPRGADHRGADHPVPQLFSPVPAAGAPPPPPPKIPQPPPSPNPALASSFEELHASTRVMPQVPPPNKPPYRPPTPMNPIVLGGQTGPTMTAQSGRPLAQDSGALASMPVPHKSGPSVGLVLGALVGVIVLGIGGIIGYVRIQQMRVGAISGPAIEPPIPTESASASASASVSAVPSASVLATAVVPVPPPASVSVAPSASEVPSAAPSATASTPAIAEGMGLLKTAGAAPGRRIFVDDKTLGQTPESVTIPCGMHAVRLGSSGKPQKIDVPCGSEISVGDKF